jgi:hypothetical protein
MTSEPSLSEKIGDLLRLWDDPEFQDPASHAALQRGLESVRQQAQGTHWQPVVAQHFPDYPEYPPPSSSKPSTALVVCQSESTADLAELHAGIDTYLQQKGQKYPSLIIQDEPEICKDEDPDMPLEEWINKELQKKEPWLPDLPPRRVRENHQLVPSDQPASHSSIRVTQPTSTKSGGKGIFQETRTKVTISQTGKHVLGHRSHITREPDGSVRVTCQIGLDGYSRDIFHSHKGEFDDQPLVETNPLNPLTHRVEIQPTTPQIEAPQSTASVKPSACRASEGMSQQQINHAIKQVMFESRAYSPTGALNAAKLMREMDRRGVDRLGGEYPWHHLDRKALIFQIESGCISGYNGKIRNIAPEAVDNWERKLNAGWARVARGIAKMYGNKSTGTSSDTKDLTGTQIIRSEEF